MRRNRHAQATAPRRGLPGPSRHASPARSRRSTLALFALAATLCFDLRLVDAQVRGASSSVRGSSSSSSGSARSSSSSSSRSSSSSFGSSRSSGSSSFGSSRSSSPRSTSYSAPTRSTASTPSRSTTFTRAPAPSRSTTFTRAPAPTRAASHVVRPTPVQSTPVRATPVRVTPIAPRPVAPQPVRPVTTAPSVEVRGGTATTRAPATVQVRGGAATTRDPSVVQVRGGDATVRVDPRGTDPRRAPPVRVDVRHPASGGGSGVVVRGRGPSVVVEQPPTLIAHGETYVDYGVDVVEHQDWASAQFDEQFDEPGVEIIEHGSATYVDGQVILEPMGHAEHANELVVGVPAEVVEVAPETPFRMRAHLGLNLGYTIQGAVRGSIDARISFPRGFELDLGYAGYLAEGYAGQPDALGLGRFALSYRMGSDAFYVRLGSGLRRFRDVEGALTGVDAGAGLGVLGERVSFTVDGTAGVIGRAYILGTRIELGIQLQPWVQLVVGLDHVSLISRDLGGGGAALTTPSIGIRLTTR